MDHLYRHVRVDLCGVAINQRMETAANGKSIAFRMGKQTRIPRSSVADPTGPFQTLRVREPMLGLANDDGPAVGEKRPAPGYCYCGWAFAYRSVQPAYLASNSIKPVYIYKGFWVITQLLPVIRTRHGGVDLIGETTRCSVH